MKFDFRSIERHALDQLQHKGLVTLTREPDETSPKGWVGVYRRADSTNGGNAR